MIAVNGWIDLIQRFQQRRHADPAVQRLADNQALLPLDFACHIRHDRRTDINLKYIAGFFQRMRSDVDHHRTDLRRRPPLALAHKMHRLGRDYAADIFSPAISDLNLMRRHGIRRPAA